MADQSSPLDVIEQKLDVLIRLLAAGVGAGLPVSERAPMLSRAGLDRKAIAAVCNSTPEAIGVRLAEAKRGKSKKR